MKCRPLNTRTRMEIGWYEGAHKEKTEYHVKYAENITLGTDEKT